MGSKVIIPSVRVNNVANSHFSALPEHCTSSLRATSRRYVASGRRHGVSRPSRKMTHPPVGSAARPSSQTAVATFAPTARLNSALAAEAVCLCAPTMWESWPPALFPLTVISSMVYSIHRLVSLLLCVHLASWSHFGQTKVYWKDGLALVVVPSRPILSLRLWNRCFLKHFRLCKCQSTLKTAYVLSCVYCDFTAAIKQAWQALAVVHLFKQHIFAISISNIIHLQVVLWLYSAVSRKFQMILFKINKWLWPGCNCATVSINKCKS